MDFPHIQKFTKRIADSAQALGMARLAAIVGGIFFIMISLPSMDMYGIIIGGCGIVFWHNTKSISHHFHVTPLATTMRIHTDLEKYPPLNPWLVQQESREITPDLYDELERLMTTMDLEVLHKKIKQVLSYRDGIITNYDLANIVMMAESYNRYTRFKSRTDKLKKFNDRLR